MFEKKYINEYVMAHVDVIYPDGYAFLFDLDEICEKNIGYSYATVAYVTDDGRIFDFNNNVFLSTERDFNEISYVIKHYEPASNYCPIYNKKLTKRRAVKTVEEYYPKFYDIY